jgi:hypothetical protein
MFTSHLLSVEVLLVAIAPAQPRLKRKMLLSEWAQQFLEKASPTLLVSTQSG